ncbi:hypothetical protein GCM10010156_05470 [Planobispora rosea]|uniref:Novel STAND NTPase 1 domain-containing protein n=1 Tax=Planobispora rosea TaxID=35762 RepID=A0A8J3S133_PLARO|nr:WD40 repeat domain-containing protein [Planobispora rosea]GGS49684.1 hypothetical protein GCM10010156_05470 [Planobispora rosea]GIH83832.1 hypothetical protein Pro02_22400 [Planobispora rosea]
MTLAYVKACGGDLAHWEAHWRRTAEETNTASPRETGASADTAPYLGLAPFQPQDAGRFHGRGRLVAEFIARLSRQRFLAVFGASGSGKSSLLRAGLIPAVADHGVGGRAWRTILMTPGTDPLDECAVRLAAVSDATAEEIHTVLTANARELPRLLGRSEPDQPTLLVVDQFEEVFTLCGPLRRTRFITTLLAAAQAAGSPLHVVLGVRADFYPHCADHPELAEALTDSQILIGPMTTEELRQAITQPARDAGCTVESALLAAIISDTAGQPAVLPLVSHALLETWRRRRGNTLTLAGYQAAGGIHGALAKTAEGLYVSLTPAQQACAKDLFVRLTALGEGTGDTGRRIRRDELNPGDDTRAVLDAFADHRLITLGVDTVQVAHEALIRAWPRLHQWLSADREGLRIHRHLTQAAQAWVALNHDPGGLYRGTRLALAREWASRDDRHTTLNASERTFLDASVQAEDAERLRTARRTRQLRYLAIGLALLLLITVGTGVVAVRQWREAVTAHQMALSRQFAMQALDLADSDPGAAMLLAAQAYRTAPTTEARSALLSMSSLRAYRGSLTGHIGAVSQILFTSDGRLLISTGRDRAVHLWDVRSGAHQATLSGHDTWLKAAALSPGGDTLATGGEDGALALWDMTARTRTALLPGHTRQIREIAFSADGRTVATASDDTTVIVWDVERRIRLTTLTGHSKAVRGLAFSPDGRTLVTTGDDKMIILWDLARHARLATLTGHDETASAVTFSPDGRTLATAGGNTTVFLWDVARRTRLATFTHGQPGQVITLRFSPDGDTLATSGHDPTILLWDVERRSLRGRFTGHKANVYTLDFDPEGRTLAAAGEDGTITLWDVTQAPLAGHTAEATDAVFSPDGRILATASSRRLMRWNVADHTLRSVDSVDSPQINALAFSPDGRILAAAGGAVQPPSKARDSTVTLWFPGEAEPIELAGHTGPVLDAAFSPDGRTLATAGADKTVILWDTDPHRVIDRICRTVTRHFIRKERERHMPAPPYREACTPA